MAGAGAPPKTMALSVTSISKVAVIVTSLRAGVLRISARMKRSAIGPSLVMKGKQVRVDIRLPLISATLPKVAAQP
jgi:hypothetical protein